MVLELYLDLLSQPSRAVYIFAKKNNIPFIMKSIEMLKEGQGRAGVLLGSPSNARKGAGRPLSSLTGQMFSEEFNKVNVLRKVPVLKDGDFTLEESTAILLYLTRKYNTPSHWYPPDMKKRARVDEYLAWQHTNIRTTASKILWLKVVIPLFLGQQVPQEKVQDAMEDLNLSLQKLEEKFLQEKPFIIGNEISLADLVAVVELMQPMGAGCDVLEGRPKLQEWRKRVEVTLGKELFAEAHARILNPQELRSISVDPPLKAQMKPAILKMLK
uniref:glutathione transferase n=1 Tax=Pogona vitticeps TaxID=103695 RepID=A0ABM5F242_9SAUR